MLGLLHGVLWNLFLAVIPVFLAWVLAWAMGAKGKRGRLPPVITVPLLVVWLLFLPNTCYLLSEWRHLLLDPRWGDLLETGENSRWVMFAAAKWALFYCIYSGAGVLLFVLAIRPLEGWLRSTGRTPLLFAPILFFLTSLGVYLGLIVRKNSWDVLRQPGDVLQTSLDALTHPRLLLSIVVFALVLWLIYEAVDLWVEGVVGRLRNWGVLDAPARGG